MDILPLWTLHVLYMLHVCESVCEKKSKKVWNNLKCLKRFVFQCTLKLWKWGFVKSRKLWNHVKIWTLTSLMLLITTLIGAWCVNPLSTRPHQNVVWYNNSWLGFLKNSELCTKRKRKNILHKMSPHLSQLNVAMADRNYFRRNNLQILKLATYIKIEDHYFRCKLATF